MPSASATQETEKQHRITCPSQGCRKLLVKNGQVKCNSNHETSLVELQVIRLLSGETTHENFLNELRSHIRFSELPPAHEPVRKIMGDNFIALHEVVPTEPKYSAIYVSTFLEVYLSMLTIPFSLETLEETKYTHWLVPLLPWQNYMKKLSMTYTGTGARSIQEFGPIYNMLCNCHEEWKHCTVKEQTSPLPQWMLLEKNATPTLSSIREFTSYYRNRTSSTRTYRRDKVIFSPLYSNEPATWSGNFIPTTAELLYAHWVIRTRRKTELITDKSVWCGPVYTPNHPFGTFYVDLSTISAEPFDQRNKVNKLLNRPHQPYQQLRLLVYPQTADVQAYIQTARIPNN